MKDGKANVSALSLSSNFLLKMLQLSTLKFLRNLKKNNNKPWFDSHRAEYDAAKADFEKFIQQLKNRSAQSQQSLFPQTITFNAADFALVLEMQQEIEALGFRIEVFGKNTILVNGVPGNISSRNERDLFEGLIEQFKINQAEISVPLGENLARALAKRASIKTGQVLIREEMKALIDQLFVCVSPNYSPDGRATFFIFDMSKIESYFNRP